MPKITHEQVSKDLQIIMEDDFKFGKRYLKYQENYSNIARYILQQEKRDELLERIEKAVKQQLKMNREILASLEAEDVDMREIEAQIIAMELIEYLLESELNDNK